MSRLDITWAGLSDEQHRRLGMAAQLLGAHGVRVAVRDWDGTRCDALVVDTGDTYGLASMGSALRRHIRVLGFSADTPAVDDGTRLISPSSPAALIARRLAELAAPDGVLVDAAHAAPPGAAVPCLVALADDGCWHDGAVALACGHLRLLLDRRDSRVWLQSDDDVDLDAVDHIDLDDWTRLPGPPPLRVDGSPLDAHAVLLPATLDSLLLTAAQRARTPLPSFPDGAWSLREWPDLGTATQAIDCLRVVRALLRAPCSPRQLVETHGFAPATVDAALWAFRAGGLLRRDRDAPVSATPPAPPAPSLAPGLFRRLARRFGLAA